MIKDFDGKRYELGGVYKTKKSAEELAEGLRIGRLYFARIEEDHLSLRGSTIPHPDDVKMGNCRTFYRVWQRKNPDHPLWQAKRGAKATAKRSRTHTKAGRTTCIRCGKPLQKYCLETGTHICIDCLKNQGSRYVATGNPRVFTRAKIARNQRMKTYDVYHYDIWGAHHFVTTAPNKEEIYERARKQGYKRSQVEAFER